MVASTCAASAAVPTESASKPACSRPRFKSATSSVLSSTRSTLIGLRLRAGLPAATLAFRQDCTAHGRRASPFLDEAPQAKRPVGRGRRRLPGGGGGGRVLGARYAARQRRRAPREGVARGGRRVHAERDAVGKPQACHRAASRIPRRARHRRQDAINEDTTT